MDHAERPDRPRRAILMWIKHRLRWHASDEDFEIEVTEAGVLAGLGPDPAEPAHEERQGKVERNLDSGEADLNIAYFDTSEENITEGDAPGDRAQDESEIVELEPTPRGGLQSLFSGPQVRVIFDSTQKRWLVLDASADDE